MHRLLPHLLPHLLLALFLAGCSATGSDEGGPVLRITYRDYRSGQRLELVSESHTTRVQQYSAARDDASRKVQEDDVMEAAIEHLDDLGFADRAAAGSAPGGASSRFSRSLEIERPSGISYVATGPTSTLEDHKLMTALVSDFLALYNATMAFQSVENPLGELLFVDPKRDGTR